MEPNQTYIAKADLQVANLVNEGGYVNAEQSKQFFELAIQESVLMGLVDVKPMNTPSYELSKMGFTGRVLRGATEGQALSEADRVRPNLAKTTLNTVEFIAEARIPYAAVEDNVSGGSFIPYMTELLGKAIARDIEDVVINGDTLSADTLLSKLDGVLKQAVSIVVNVGGVRLSKSVLKQMIQSMPSAYYRGAKNLGFFTSKNAVIDYVDGLSNRQTPFGDQALTKVAPADYIGLGIVPIPLFPENLGAGTNMTAVLLTDPKNIVIGMQRQIKLETAKDISAREYIIVATLRFDVKFRHEPAVVKATNVLATAGA